MKILVTGGAGFIGSAVVRFLINQTNDEVLNVDSLIRRQPQKCGDCILFPTLPFLKVDLCDLSIEAFDFQTTVNHPFGC